MTNLTIKTSKQHGEADLVFHPGVDSPDLLNQLHDTVIGAVDGVSAKGNVRDSVVAIRKGDFPEVVQRLADYYRQAGFAVDVE